MRVLLAILMSSSLMMGLTSRVHASTSQQSQVDINLVPSDDDSAVDPVDPQDPSQPYPGDTADDGLTSGTGSRDQLSLDFLSNLTFKPITASRGPVTTTAANSRAMIQITDRRGTGAGWTLQVTPSALTNTSQALTATIDLGSVTIKSAGTNVSRTPRLVNQGHLTVGSVNNVLVADKNAGVGTWLLLLNQGTEPTTLTIHNQQLTAGSYSGELTWSLTNAPS